MAQIRISDELYRDAQRRASEAGFANVDDYVSDILTQELVDDGPGETPNLQHLFTPERLTHIEKARAEPEAGKYFTEEQVREHFKQKRAEWEKKNGQR